jgi:hypothetical protein
MSRRSRRGAVLLVRIASILFVSPHGVVLAGIPARSLACEALACLVDTLEIQRADADAEPSAACEHLGLEPRSGIGPEYVRSSPKRELPGLPGAPRGAPGKPVLLEPWEDRSALNPDCFQLGRIESE